MTEFKWLVNYYASKEMFNALKGSVVHDVLIGFEFIFSFQEEVVVIYYRNTRE